MKKLLVLLVALAMSVVLMAGCGNTGSTAQTINIYVDANGTEDTTHYKTISSAINYVKTLNADDIKIINISAGDYVEKVSIDKSIKNIQLIGATEGTTKITYGDYAGMKDQSGGIIGTDATATVNVYSEGFIAKNIYFENSFDYFNPPEGVTDLQALAMYCRADKVVFENCIFTGYQDTLEVVEGRQYFKNCTIKGCVDFIFGNNPSVLFDNCDIVSVNRNDKNGGYITAMKGNSGNNGEKVATYGLVFKGCRLTAEAGVLDNSVALGRPWRADATVAWINCEMGAHIGVNACQAGNSRYTSMSGGGQANYPFMVNYVEYGNTGVGAVSEELTMQGTYTIGWDAALGQTIKGTATGPDFKLLSKEQADLYTPENIFATTNGGVTYEGEWNPCK